MALIVKAIYKRVAWLTDVKKNAHAAFFFFTGDSVDICGAIQG
jgi:hypothetical protein